MEVICRKAKVEDVDIVHDLINDYAEKGIMLPRSKEILIKQLDTFVIAEVEGSIVGCGSLCRLGDNLVEIRSLGINDGFKGKGIGSKLVDYLLEEAKNLQITKVMALTYEDKFFARKGFTIVEKEIFPEKVWTDCIHCRKQHCCDEIAMLKVLD